MHQAADGGGQAVGTVFLVVVFGGAYPVWCHLIGKTAERKGSAYGAWFLIALLLPVMSALLVARLPDRTRS